MRESWWIDILEGELSSDKLNGVELLTKPSVTDKKIISSLKQVKTLVKEQTDDEMPEDELYYKKLHRNIMDSIHSYEMTKNVENKKKKQQSQNQLAKIKTAKFYFSMGM